MCPAPVDAPAILLLLELPLRWTGASISSLADVWSQVARNTGSVPDKDRKQLEVHTYLDKRRVSLH